MAGVSRIPIDQQLGVSRVFDDDADATCTQDVDGGPTTLYELTCTNANGSLVYIQLYDAVQPVVGTTAQDYQLPVPANSTIVYKFVDGEYFANGLSWACTTDKGTAANTSPGTPPDIWAVTVPDDQ